MFLCVLILGAQSKPTSSIRIISSFQCQFPNILLSKLLIEKYSVLYGVALRAISVHVYGLNFPFILCMSVDIKEREQVLL